MNEKHSISFKFNHGYSPTTKLILLLLFLIPMVDYTMRKDTSTGHYYLFNAKSGREIISAGCGNFSGFIISFVNHIKRNKLPINIEFEMAGRDSLFAPRGDISKSEKDLIDSVVELYNSLVSRTSDSQ